MKMTLFAFGAWCGFFGASGLTYFVTPSAATACLAKKPPSSNPASASPVKPAPASQRNSRRVRPQKSRMTRLPTRLLRRIQHLSADDRMHGLRLEDVVLGTGQDVLRQHDQVGQF